MRPLPRRFVAMDRLALDAVDSKRAMAALPPLVKAYMRVGAKFGDGAVVDREFGVTDVFVVMPIAEIEARYIEYFSDLKAVAHRTSRVNQCSVI